jgi:hypothetical protein
LEADVIRSFAEAAANYLGKVEAAYGVRIERVAIDAPSGPCSLGETRRQAELDLDKRGIRCIATPTSDSFDQILRRARAHLAAGGAESRIPAANQLWMLAGFELFKRLARRWECIEVFPQAIVAMLGAAKLHKSTAAGIAAQLAATSRLTRWPTPPEPKRLAPIGFGSRSDKLDAYLSAWVASLSETEREVLGLPPDDAIWIPRAGDIC